MTAGQRIQQARKKAGLSQKQLGEKLGLSASMIGQWENDLRNPKYETCRRIADALGINILYLLTSEEMDRGILELIKADYDSDDAFYKDFIEKRVSLMLLDSHTALELLNAGYETVVYDNLSNSSRESVKRVEELTEIPRYRRQEPAQPPTGEALTSKKGKDTPTAQDAPEGAEKAE